MDPLWIYLCIENIFFDAFLCSKVGWKWHFLEILSMKNLILMVYWNKKNVAAAFEQRVIEMRQTKSLVLGIEAVGIKHNRTNCHNRLFWKKSSDKDYFQLFQRWLIENQFNVELNQYFITKCNTFIIKSSHVVYIKWTIVLFEM